VTNTALDNDLLIKGACYWLLPEILEATGSTTTTCGVLGAAKYVCANALMNRGLKDALDCLIKLLNELVLLDPSETEASIAAEIELEAQRSGLNLDVGESILFAIVSVRNIPVLATGDKRAIAAIEKIVIERHQQEFWSERVLCLEQIIRRILGHTDPISVRDRICAAPTADKSLAICFSCAGGTGDADAWISGLNSYIAAIRKIAPAVLAPN
jgi:hypothetical protein